MAHTSQMTARERVRETLAHRPPCRVPFSWQFCATEEMQRTLERELAGRGISWPTLRIATEDICTLSPKEPWTTCGAGRVRDIWGIIWADVAYGGGQYREVAQSPFGGEANMAELGAYPWPDPDTVDYVTLQQQAEQTPSDRATKLACGNPFETLCWMTGLEETLCRCLTEPEWIVAALGRITQYYSARLRQSLEALDAAPDILFFCDDLGSQQGPLMSPAMYRELLQPFHARLFAEARTMAPEARIMMHSDGAVMPLLDDLLDAGLEVLEAVQTDCVCMEPEVLKERFGARLAFHGGISVQQVLPHADAATVEAECARLVRVFGAGGGYVAAPSHAIQPGTPVVNVLAMLRGILGPEAYDEALFCARLDAAVP